MSASLHQLHCAAPNPRRVRQLIRALGIARRALRDELGSDVEAVIDPDSGMPILLRSGQEALVQAEAYHHQLSTILENVRDSVVVLDRDGRITHWNGGSAALFGYAASEMLGGSIGLLHPDLSDAALRAELQHVWDGGEHRIVCECRTKDGHMLWVDVRSAPLRDADGEVAGILRVANDVSEHKRLEAELRRASEEADQANRAKSHFLANMSHEIRTPMNGIIGMTDLVLDSELSADQRRCLNVVHESADALMSIINDILDFSKIEAGKIDLHCEAFDLHQIVDRVLKRLPRNVQQRQPEIVCRIDANVPRALEGDAGRLAQVLTNLLGNAVKFCDGGEVEVHISRHGGNTLATVLHVSVRDTGIGIPLDKQALIFKAFEQVDGSSTRRYGGTGLGLAICSSLVALMGGQIWVESEPGAGSTFHFTAQFGLDPAAVAPPAPPAALVGQRALVLDDTLLSRDWLVECLTRWGLLTTAVGTVDEARDAWVSAVGAPYRLLLVDAAMPGEDGWALLEWISKQPGGGELPRIVLAESSDRAATERAAALGAGYVAKPLCEGEILATLTGALTAPRTLEVCVPRRPAAPGPAAVANPPAARLLRVLVAEDQDINQELICRLLIRQGHFVALASDGREALERWRRERFDLVLMDVQMPQLDGLETTAAIRAAERGRGEHVPIIALTAHAMQGDAARCLASGMDAYVTKPLHAQDLLGILDRIAGGDAAFQGTAAAASESVDTALDLERCLQIVGGQGDLLVKMASAFLSKMPARVEALREAVAQRDLPNIVLHAHSIKGTLANFAADAAVAAARAMEGSGQHDSPTDAAQCLARLELEIARVSHALSDLPTRARTA